MDQNKEWENTERFVSIKKFFGRVYQKKWYVLSSLVIALVAAYLYNRYENPIYSIKADFVAKKFEENNNSFFGLPDVASSRNKNISASSVILEIPLLKSVDIISATLDKIDLQTAYYKVGKLKTSEIYKPYRYIINTNKKSTYVPYNTPIYVNSYDENSYYLFADDEKLNLKLDNKNFKFGKEYDVDGWVFNVSFNRELVEANGDAYYFIIKRPQSLVSEYRNKLNIVWATKGSALLNTTINSDLPERDLDFLKTYLDVLIEKKLEEKNQSLTNSIKFIDEYMVQISDTIIRYQKVNDKMRLNNRELINGSEYIFKKLTELDNQKTKLVLANTYYNNLLRYIEQNRASEVFAPDMIGLNAPLLSDLLSQYIEIKWTDQIDLNEANALNPLVLKKNEEELMRLEKNIYEVVKNLQQSNREEIQEIEQETRFYLGSIDEYQVTTREYFEMERMLSLYEGLFNSLLSRRTDAFISKASTTSDYQIVTPAWFSGAPIYPDKNRNLMIAFLLGLGIPLGLIYLFDLANDKIIDKDDLQKNTNIPIIGNVGHSPIEGNLVVLNRPKSIISEAFRGIRANLKFFTNSQKDENQVFLITSSISGEGKTFCSINLAYTYSISGKKTLIIGADLRKPTLSNNFGIQNNEGLSQYLAGIAGKEDIIHPTERENLFVMPSGPVPPNPSELLHTPRMADLIKWARHNYDVIIFDTPPIGLVADAMELLKYSDVNLLIVRQFKTYKKSLTSITEMYNDKKIQRLGIVFNDINFIRYEYGYGYGKNYGYGSGYGYGYYDEDKKKKSWWQKLVKR